MYIYIYILTNLQSTSIHDDKEKEKKPCQNSEITNLESLPGEKRKKLLGEKKKRPTLSDQLKKNQEICNQLVKRTKTHHKMLQCYNYKKYSILNRANYKN